VRWLVGISFVMHGLGHTMGLLAAWTRVDVGFTDDPWIFLDDVHVQDLLGRAWGMPWLVALVGWVGAGLVVLGGLLTTWGRDIADRIA